MTAKEYIAAHIVAWNYEKPSHGGAKSLLLTIGGIAIVGIWSGEVGDSYLAWAPLPKRDKEQERRILEQMRPKRARKVASDFLKGTGR
jgi:hypothetical protein